MISKLKAVLDDDRGVSPVIGVILMVAITVILAAVIGTFVLGLGDSLEQAPQAQLDAVADDGTDMTISHNGGDAIAAGDLKITTDAGESHTDGFSLGSDDEFNVGDSITLAHGGGTGDDVQVQVIHEPSESIILDTEITVP